MKKVAASEVGQASILSGSAGFQSAILHVPEDMTASVAASVTLAELQTALAKSRQWLPIDSPTPTSTIAELLNSNASGPRRFGYGTPRDYVIGLKVRLADGRLVKSGGQVVKNVAGYDLQKLFIGSGGTLALPVEVTFKLRPLPACERFVQQRFTDLDAAGHAIESVVASELGPIVFDLHRADGSELALVLGFDGTQEDVAWQLAAASKLGFTEQAGLKYDRAFHTASPPVRKHSVLPSQLVEFLRGLGDAPFVARAGNGIIFHRVNLPPAPASPATLLFRRVKDAFDPHHLLPGISA